MQTFMPNHVKGGEIFLPKSPTPYPEKVDGMMLIF